MPGSKSKAPQQPKPPDENDRHRDGTLPDDPFEDADPIPPSVGPVREVLQQLDLKENGRPKPTLQNIVRVFEADPRWTGRIRFNELSSSDELEHAPVADGLRRRSDTLDGEVGLWLADHYRLDVKTGLVAEGISIVAARHAHHPVRVYLRDLRWDGTSRAPALFVKYFGAVDTELVRSLGQAFLLSCIARVIKPGSKVDTTPILVGSQGAKKSTGLRVLAVRPEWFADTHLDLGSKDTFETIQGRWIYELAELDAFKGREWSRIKSLLSSPRDTWRRPYGRHSVQVDRQVVFCGTTNEDTFLGDPTGSRRFWPVRVGEVDVAALLRDRDQLWAEAFQLFNAGARWWLDDVQDRALATASEEFRIQDPWEELILQWVYGRSGVTTADVLEQAVKKPKDTWTQNDQTRVVAVLRRSGWTQTRPRAGAGTAGRGRVWDPPV
jgi:putative DNA primase/helicase